MYLYKCQLCFSVSQLLLSQAILRSIIVTIIITIIIILCQDYMNLQDSEFEIESELAMCFFISF